MRYDDEDQPLPWWDERRDEEYAPMAAILGVDAPTNSFAKAAS